MKYLSLLFAAGFALTLISCSQDKGIVGKWKGLEGQNNFAVDTIEFQESGVFFFGATEGTWAETAAGRIEIRFKNVLPNAYDYVVQDNTLTLKDQVGVAGVFERME
jgi:hypothetical protein